jgi:hypothetical protein
VSLITIRSIATESILMIAIRNMHSNMHADNKRRARLAKLPKSVCFKREPPREKCQAGYIISQYRGTRIVPAMRETAARVSRVARI